MLGLLTGDVERFPHFLRSLGKSARFFHRCRGAVKSHIPQFAGHFLFLWLKGILSHSKPYEGVEVVFAMAAMKV